MCRENEEDRRKMIECMHEVALKFMALNYMKALFIWQIGVGTFCSPTTFVSRTFAIAGIRFFSHLSI